jgi:hypothetical protein
LTIVVLLILVVIWAAVLVPSFLRRKLEHRSGDSIGAFHQQLRVLERAGPTLVAPAYRLRTSLPDAMARHRPRHTASGRPGLVLVRPDAPGLVADRRRSVPHPDPYFRPGACKRRRDVLLCLVSAVIGTGLLGAIPSLRALLWVTMFAGVMVGVYLGMLVRMRNRAVERSAKLRYLPPPMEPEVSIVIRRSAAR